LNSLSILGDTMANQGFHFSTYITRISFDPNEAHPKMIFRPLQGLTDKEAPVILDLRAEAVVGRITGGDVALEITHDGAPLVEVLPPLDLSTTGTAAAPETVQSGPKTLDIVSKAKASAPLATAVGDVAALPSSQAKVETGFGGAASASPQAPDGAPKPAEQTTADTGDAEESDDELDARIAGMINTQ